MKKGPGGKLFCKRVFLLEPPFRKLLYDCDASSANERFGFPHTSLRSLAVPSERRMRRNPIKKSMIYVRNTTSESC